MNLIQHNVTSLDDIEPEISFVPHNNETDYVNSTEGFYQYQYHLDYETFRTFITNQHHVANDHEYQWRKHIYMVFYISLAILVLVVDVVRTIYMFYFTMRISRNLHKKMFACIVEAPVKFFDDNPSGKQSKVW